MSNEHLIPEHIVTMMSVYFDGYTGYDFTGIVAPAEVWAEMYDLLHSLDNDKIKARMNGCGSMGAGGIVPDTIWGLRVTAICNIHDITHALAETPEDCIKSNKLFLSNLITFINNNSANFVMRVLRRYRAVTYYSAVEEAKKQFCNGYRYEHTR